MIDTAPRPPLETDPALLARYELIERGEPGHAAGLLRPASEAELQAALLDCNARRRRLVISAGRTGLVEAQRPDGDVVLSLERLNRPLAVHWANGQVFAFAPDLPPMAWRDSLLAAWEAAGRPDCEGLTVTVQAGIAIDTLNELLAPLGRMFPMEMGSSAAATVGAAAANASAGANALCYGTGAHMSEAAWGYWGDGSPAGPCRATPWQVPDPERLAVDSATVHPGWGLLGSQGVLGVISHLRVRSFPIPAQREAALVPVPDMPAATRLLGLARARFGQDVEEYEFISATALDLVRRLRGEQFRLPFEQAPDAPYLVLLQIKSADPDAELAGALYQFLSEAAGYADASIGYGPLAALKGIRHSITEASNARMRALGGGRLSFDTATPLACFGEYLDALAATLAKDAPEVLFVAFGHVGVGGAHLHLLGNATQPVKRREAELVARVIDVTLAHRGTFSAEHGIGPKWGVEFQKRASSAQRAELAALKRRHDPNGVLNPRSFGLDRMSAA